MKFPSLMALETLILTTFRAVSDEDFFNMMTTLESALDLEQPVLKITPCCLE